MGKNNSFGIVYAQRRPYSAFALSNPLLTSGADLVDYSLYRKLAEIDPKMFGVKYLELAIPFADAVRTLSPEGPMLEDADI